MGGVFMLMLLAIPLLAILSKSDIGQALADAIRHNSGASAGASGREIEELRADVEHLRTTIDEMHAQLMENAERLDFAERMISSPAIDTAKGES